VKGLINLNNFYTLSEAFRVKEGAIAFSVLLDQERSRHGYSQHVQSMTNSVFLGFGLKLVTICQARGSSLL
jgi:hypothetical protein